MKLFRRKQKTDEKEEQGNGVFLWFNSETISDAGYPLYGRYVYERLLPFFNIKVYDQKDMVMPGGRYGFYDGNALPRGDVKLPAKDKKEEQILEEAKFDNYYSTYVVAVYSWNAADFSPLERKVRNLLGFIGMTTCESVDYRGFDVLTGELSLPYAISLVYDEIEKESFGFLSDIELEKMGFNVRLR